MDCSGTEKVLWVIPGCHAFAHCLDWNCAKKLQSQAAPSVAKQAVLG